MAARDKVWQGVLYGAAAVTLVLGIVEAIREQQLTGALDPGTPPPAFTAVQRDGAAFSLSQERGKAVVLSFWATWCPPCLREMPQLRKLEAELGAQGMALVAASMDNPDVRERMGEFGTKRVRDVLSWAHSVLHLLKAYETVLGAGSTWWEQEERERAEKAVAGRGG